MRAKIVIPVTLLVLAMLTVLSVRAVDPLKAFAYVSTDDGATNTHVIISANSVGPGTPIVTYLNATSDKAGSVLQSYTSTYRTVCTNANATTAIKVASTNGWAPNDVMIIWHVATDTYDRCVASTTAGTGAVVVVWAPLTACAAGDLVYEATAAASIPVGNATVTVGPGDGILAGQKGKPLLIDLDSTSAGVISACSGYYLQ